MGTIEAEGKMVDYHGSLLTEIKARLNAQALTCREYEDVIELILEIKNVRYIPTSEVEHDPEICHLIGKVENKISRA